MKPACRLMALLLVAVVGVLAQADDVKFTTSKEATKLLTEARQARATWNAFPGFTAQVQLTTKGKSFQTVLQVSEKGKVTLGELPADLAPWAKRLLTSVVDHRLSNGDDLNTPCSFADDDAHHPLGRLVNVLNDEMASSYRIKNQQIMMVNREMQGTRFSITIQDNLRNEEGKYLPRCYAVNYWDTKTGDLKKSENHSYTWQRIGGIDLPTLIRVNIIEKAVETRELTLTNIKLMKN